MKRTFILLMVLAIFGFILAACGDSADLTENDEIINNTNSPHATLPGINTDGDSLAEMGFFSVVWNGDEDKALAANIDAVQNNTRKDASGIKITSNAHSDDFPGIYFIWDSNQKDNGYLKVSDGVFAQFESFILTSKEANAYWDFLITPQAGQQKTDDNCYVFFILKVNNNKNINMVFVSEWVEIENDNPVIPPEVKDKDRPVLPLDMVWINPGTFMMGSPASEPDRAYDEGTQHEVTLTRGFYMGKYPVTWAQYQAVMGSNPSYFINKPDTCIWHEEVQENRPVEQVSWYDAIVFCNKLSMLEGLSPAYSLSGTTDPAAWGTMPSYSPAKSIWDTVEMLSDSNGYRLPTEAQWEYACRAGTTTAYNTGDTISDNTGWHGVNSGGITHEVGLKPANAWGLYDMHGNVWEWCWDWYERYSGLAQTDPTGVSAGDSRVFRGGRFDTTWNMRSASRDSAFPSMGTNAHGFRLVRP